MSKIYFDNWAESGEEGMIKDFANDKDEVFKLQKQIEKYEIIFAVYAYGSYCGDCYVLMKKGGKYFVVEGSHCSCFGLERQFNPIETHPLAFAKECSNRDDWSKEAIARFIKLQKELKGGI